ncbi:MAG TPA: c-type cytochrome [Albitalea sp.]
MRPHLPVTPPAAGFVLAALLALAACGGPPAPDAAYRAVPQGDADRGRVLFARYQCGRCHAVPDAPSASITVAPPLEAFGERSYIAGRVPNRPDTLQRWLQAPQSLVPETTMPDLGVSAEDARDLAAYLLSLS